MRNGTRDGIPGVLYRPRTVTVFSVVMVFCQEAGVAWRDDGG